MRWLRRDPSPADLRSTMNMPEAKVLAGRAAGAGGWFVWWRPQRRRRRLVRFIRPTTAPIWLPFYPSREV